jgi:RsiW-degrading membrane proteinase PrsW (M82 family)
MELIVQSLLRASAALLPVLLFLSALFYFDSFKVVRPLSILVAIAAGVLAAAASYWVNGAAYDAIDVSFRNFSRFVSPWLEELLKGALLVYLIRTRRVGMLVDAAIYGFAIGTGFALFENVYYLALRPEAHPAVQVIRGFGTAIMHGGATAIFAFVAVSIAERHPDGLLRVYLPGLLAAVFLHAGFNILLVRPAVATLGMLLFLPPLIYFIFEYSERSLRAWLESDLDSDVQLLESINSGSFPDSHAGRYLHSLSDRFRGEVVADMLCYLRLHVELALRAKGLLLLRESGFDEPPLDDDLRAQLQELRYLERSLGRTGQLALRPLLMATSKDLWQLQWLAR